MCDRDKDARQPAEPSLLTNILGEECDPAARTVRHSATKNDNIRKVKSQEDEVAEKKLEVRQAVKLWIAGVRTKCAFVCVYA
jgi:hypothetical protein